MALVHDARGAVCYRYECRGLRGASRWGFIPGGCTGPTGHLQGVVVPRSHGLRGNAYLRRMWRCYGDCRIEVFILVMRYHAERGNEAWSAWKQADTKNPALGGALVVFCGV